MLKLSLSWEKFHDNSRCVIKILLSVFTIIPTWGLSHLAFLHSSGGEVGTESVKHSALKRVRNAIGIQRTAFPVPNPRRRP